MKKFFLSLALVVLVGQCLVAADKKVFDVEAWRDTTPAAVSSKMLVSVSSYNDSNLPTKVGVQRKKTGEVWMSDVKFLLVPGRGPEQGKFFVTTSGGPEWPVSEEIEVTVYYRHVGAGPRPERQTTFAFKPLTTKVKNKKIVMASPLENKSWESK